MKPRYLPVSLTPLLAASLAPRPQEAWWAKLSAAPPRYAELCSSARDALAIVLRALGPPGSVLVPAYTCPSVFAMLRGIGERPLPVDLDPEGGGFDPDGFHKALSPSLKAVLLTHLFGRAPDRDWIIAQADRMGVPVIEDCALVIDPAVSTRGVTARILSFGRGKPLAFGAGGALLAYDERLAGRLPVHCSEPRPRRGLLWLLKGALRDSSLALRLASYRAQRGHGAEPAEPPFALHLPTRRFQQVLGHRLASRELDTRRELMRSALEALQKRAEPITGRERMPGWRIPEEALVPAFAFRVRGRDQARQSLRREGIDCPRYWDFDCFPKDFLASFPGARELALSLLFVPIPPLLRPRPGLRLIEALADCDPQPFA
ncbi:MAG: hypothetical protein KatS3mg125_0962 [Lysobacterales bacterium]|jgi:hypothetical protein|nr:MAG: hypothetical protein KatS3mg125_0962 [Xanthomonadales bacterium]